MQNVRQSNTQLQVKQQKQSAPLYNSGQYSNPRKPVHSFGSLGYSQSQTRQSRFSHNSKNSKKSRSKSSGKSASKSGKGYKSQSNERSQPKLKRDISPQINQSQIVMSQQFLDSDIEAAKNHASFELNNLLQEAKRQQSKKVFRYQQRGTRPKSSMLFENTRDSVKKRSMNSKIGQRGQ